MNPKWKSIGVVTFEEATKSVPIAHSLNHIFIFKTPSGHRPLPERTSELVERLIWHNDVAVKKQIQKLLQKVEAGNIGSAGPWQGADVVILKKVPAPSRGNFYPAPRFVETTYVEELSWLFEQLREIFWNNDGYGAWKEEFFGRLGNVATKFQSVCPEGSLKGLLTAVIEEASTMADEIALEGGLQHLALTFDNRILDDFTLLSDNNKYLSELETKKLVDLYMGDWAIELDTASPDSRDESV